ncbi:DUF4382 domain-containing protein [Ginsengibacter hankyongi]|uniref:DUF4382 domain-containing protein n=1 Tax=Ginsengibacter hankyongi TaxID=2607284 RepID=A0A5J5IC39_9BACT|nr:DUF4382 domain-containing protein [Ginsengibacter hankyongi]KAA9035909.1 DUF4382 domain-containing protein [Ginsengibacter hankyongi]
MKISFKLFIAIVSFVSICTVACKKNSTTGPSRMTVSLTDDPSAYDAVNIDIQDIQVNSSADSGAQSGWTSLPLKRKGVYDLLDFKNGIDTVLASQELPAGTVSQIRLVLGSNNSVVINGATFPLTTPSAQQSGLKLNIHATLVAGIEYKIWLDFDAGRSIVQTGNGSYSLKPVIRTYTTATSGAIKGMVMPAGSHSIVYAIQNVSDTIGSAIADSTSGNFLIGGLQAGNYNVAIHANNSYRDSTISTNVATGVVTNLGSVQLHQ